MKKSLIALAVMAASGAAMAQSSVTLFGVVDTSIGYVDGADSWSGMANSGNASSRLGFRGTEDLGGGLKANFWIEGAINPDDGTGAANGGLNFQRRSTIGLQGNFGEVRLGRELTAAYNSTSRYDPFGTVGFASSRLWNQDANQIRINNMVTYLSPSFSGFKFAVNYAFGEVAGENRDGRYIGGSLTYDNGPLSLGLGAERLNAGGNANAVADVDSWSLGGSYNFGVAKLSAAYRNQDRDNGGDFDGYLLGLTAPVGKAGEVKLSYNRVEEDRSNAKLDQFGLGYVHSMSKRTALYGTYAYIKNKNGAAVPVASGVGPVDSSGKQHAIQVGVRHSF